MLFRLQRMLEGETPSFDPINAFGQRLGDTEMGSAAMR